MLRWNLLFRGLKSNVVAAVPGNLLAAYNAAARTRGREVVQSSLSTSRLLRNESGSLHGPPEASRKLSKTVAVLAALKDTLSCFDGLEERGPVFISKRHLLEIGQVLMKLRSAVLQQRHSFGGHRQSLAAGKKRLARASVSCCCIGPIALRSPISLRA